MSNQWEQDLEVAREAVASGGRFSIERVLGVYQAKADAHNAAMKAKKKGTSSEDTRGEKVNRTAEKQEISFDNE